MVPRAVVFALLAVLALPHASADLTLPPGTGSESVGDCITVDYGPPPYAGVGNCNKLRGGVYLNGTDPTVIPP